MMGKKEYYQMSMEEQIHAATEAYVVNLLATEEESRYAVYLHIPDYEELKLLWPYEGSQGRLLPGQVHNEEDMEYPAYFFSYDEIGTRRTAILGNTLRGINPKLKVLLLNGGVPSHC